MLCALPTGRYQTAFAAEPSPVALSAPNAENSEDVSTHKLPGRFTRVCAGAGGKYLIFNIEEQGKMALFDVETVKVVATIPTGNEKVLYAATKDALVIVRPEAEIIQSYDLNTFERKKTVSIDLPGPVYDVVAGCGSEGPVLLACRAGSVGRLAPFHPTTLKPLASYDGGELTKTRRELEPPHSHSYVSTNGQVVVFSRSKTVHALHMVGGKAEHFESKYLGRSTPVPSGTGNRIYSTGSVFTGQLRSLPEFSSTNSEPWSALLPAVSGPFYAKVTPTKQNRTYEDAEVGTVACYCETSPEPLVRFSDPGLRGSSPIRIERRFYWLPERNVVVMLPEGDDRVVLRRLDLDRELQRSGRHLLYVTSQPPSNVAVGDTLEYKVAVKATHGPATCTLESGPKGMTCSSSGTVRWKVAPDSPGERAGVVLTIRDARGKELFHSFVLTITGADGTTADVAKPPAKRDLPPLSPQEFASRRTGKRLAITPPTLAEQQASYRLPATYTDVCAAGGGRFLVFELPSIGQLAVFDVTEARVVKYLPTAGEDVLFTGGTDRVIVYYPSTGTLRSWDLHGFKGSPPVRWPHEDPVFNLVMGHDSFGPLLAFYGGKEEGGRIRLPSFHFFDPATLRRVDYGERGSSHSVFNKTRTVLQASGDGSLFTCQCVSDRDVYSFHIRGTTVNRYRGSKLGCLHPGPMGQRLFTSVGLYTPALTKDGNRDFSSLTAGAPIPALSGPLSFRVLFAERKSGSEPAVPIGVSVHVGPDCTKLCKLLDVPISIDTLRRPILIGYDRRLYYVPQARLLVTLPATNDVVALRSLDLKKEMGQHGAEYLAVTSVPPGVVAVGSRLNYQIDVLSSDGKLKFKLEEGPEGMTVSDSGEVRWPVAVRPIGGDVKALVTVTDGSGSETFHKFTIRVENAGTGVAGSGASGRPGGSLSRIDADHLEVSGPGLRYTHGLGGRYALLLHGKVLSILGPDGITPVKDYKFGNSYIRVVDRKKYLVLLSRNPAQVRLVDKKSMDTIRLIDIPHGRPLDLAGHPTLPISYVTFQWSTTKIPGCRFATLNEQTGKGILSDNFIGSGIVVDPKGRYLLTTYRDTFHAGSQLLMNPQRWHVIPRYESIRLLFSYRLSRSGLPIESDLKELAGTTLCVSRDGSRFTYVWAYGDPVNTGNQKGRNPQDLEEAPDTYEANLEIPADLPRQKKLCDLAYHPTLPLVAIAGGGKAVLIDQETGKPLPDKLKMPKGGLGESQLQRVYFSPDGRNVLFHVIVNDLHYLYRGEVNFTEAEKKKLVNRPVLPETAPAAVGGRSVALARLEALKGGRGKRLSAKQIGEMFVDSVVVIKTDEGSGSGFFVGPDGYVLTCEHCLPRSGKPIVKYRSKTSGKTSVSTIEADVLRIDRERDLALLKIRLDSPATAVRFAPPASIAMGERVCTISNPGLGDRILDHTMTEGIVSSVDRDLGDGNFIQTTAAVNPGSSGGPMFNENGLVIGLIVRKARIEGAGFAVPAADLTSFLLSAAKLKGADGAIERYWYDSSGKHRIQARFAGFEGTAVKLRRSSGKEAIVPILKLSKGDQRFLKLLYNAAKE